MSCSQFEDTLRESSRVWMRNMIAAPAIEPARLPRPPSSEVPPIATAAMAGSVYCVAWPGSPVCVAAASAIPARPANAPPRV